MKVFLEHLNTLRTPLIANNFFCFSPSKLFRGEYNILLKVEKVQLNLDLLLFNKKFERRPLNFQVQVKPQNKEAHNEPVLDFTSHLTVFGIPLTRLITPKIMTIHTKSCCRVCSMHLNQHITLTHLKMKMIYVNH